MPCERPHFKDGSFTKCILSDITYVTPTENLYFRHGGEARGHLNLPEGREDGGRDLCKRCLWVQCPLQVQGLQVAQDVHVQVLINLSQLPPIIKLLESSSF